MRWYRHALAGPGQNDIVQLNRVTTDWVRVGRETVERELDAVDLHLLRTVAAAEGLLPKNLHQQRRLDRLDLEGYVQSADHETSAAGSQALIYRLTPKGRRATLAAGPE